MIGTALALAAILADPIPAPPAAAGQAAVAANGIASASPAPMEMTPAPGRWEAEDAPAYFSDRRDFPERTARDISTAAAPEAPDHRGDGSAGALAAEDGIHGVALARDMRGAAVPLPRPRDLAAPAALPRP